MTIIGVTGKMRAGKDTVAQAIIKHRNTFERIGFADQLKKLALEIDPYIRPNHESNRVGGNLAHLVNNFGWEWAKDNYREARRFLQALGTGARKALGPETWLDAWETLAFGEKTKPFLTPVFYPDVVVPDTRFLNEAHRIKSHHGIIIRVVRPSIESTDTHVSETEMDRIVADYEVINSGSIADLEDQVAVILDKIGI